MLASEVHLERQSPVRRSIKSGDHFFLSVRRRRIRGRQTVGSPRTISAADIYIENMTVVNETTHQVRRPPKYTRMTLTGQTFYLRPKLL